MSSKSSDNRGYRFPSLVLPPLPRFPESFSRTSRSSDRIPIHATLPPIKMFDRGVAPSRSPTSENDDSNEATSTTSYSRASSGQPSVMSDDSNMEDDLLDSPVAYSPPARDKSHITLPSLNDNDPFEGGHIGQFSRITIRTNIENGVPPNRSPPPDIQQFHPDSSMGKAQKSRKPSKTKKVKYHECEICHKLFPRPSGLRTHMNIHNNERPFACSFPGCTKQFSVVSNAKRHERTHGVGLSAADEPPELPYIVDFSAPVVPPSPVVLVPKEPLNLRWMPPGVDTRRASVGVLGKFRQMSSASSSGSESNLSPPLDKSAGNPLLSVSVPVLDHPAPEHLPHPTIKPPKAPPCAVQA